MSEHNLSHRNARILLPDKAKIKLFIESRNHVAKAKLLKADGVLPNLEVVLPIASQT